MSSSDPQLVPLSSLIESSILDLDQKLDSDMSSMGISTGIQILDENMGGYQPPNKIVVAARPGVGKSALICKSVIAALGQGKRVDVFSLEMSNQQLIQRMILNLARIDSSFMTLGGGDMNIMVRNRKKDQIRTAARKLYENGGDLLMCDFKELAIDQLTSLSKEARRPDIIFVDYLQLIRGDKESRGRERHVEVASVSRGLKILAKDLWVPVVAAAQIRRPGGDSPRPPTVNDLRESGSIEQDADQVILLHREEISRPDGKGKSLPGEGEVEIILAKNRHGKTCVLSQFYIGKYYDFLPQDPYVEAFHDGEKRIADGLKDRYF